MVGEHVKTAVDVCSGAATLATIFHAAPDIAAMLACVWYIIRFAEYAYSKIKRHHHH